MKPTPFDFDPDNPIYYALDGSPLHPGCHTCGCRMGGVDSWDGRACKCRKRSPSFPALMRAWNMPLDRAVQVAGTALSVSGDLAVALDDAMDGSGWEIPPWAVVHRSDAGNAQALAEWIASQAVPRRSPGLFGMP